MEEIKRVQNVSTTTKNAIRRKSAQTLPNNPSEAGYSPDEIKRRLYGLVTDADASVLAEIDRIVNETNQLFNDIIERAERAAEIAESVREDADADKFRGYPGVNSSGGSDLASHIVMIKAEDWEEEGGEYKRVILPTEHLLPPSSALIAFPKPYRNGDGTKDIYESPEYDNDGTITIYSAIRWAGICVVASGIDPNSFSATEGTPPYRKKVTWEDDGNNGFTETIDAEEHQKGITPSVEVWQNGKQIFNTPQVDAEGNITINSLNDDETYIKVRS